MRLPINALLYLISYLLVGYAFSSENKKFPFHIGEKLEYDLSWGIIPVGNATLQIAKDKIQEEGNWKLNFLLEPIILPMLFIKFEQMSLVKLILRLLKPYFMERIN